MATVECQASSSLTITYTWLWRGCCVAAAFGLGVAAWLQLIARLAVCVCAPVGPSRVLDHLEHLLVLCPERFRQRLPHLLVIAHGLALLPAGEDLEEPLALLCRHVAVAVQGRLLELLHVHLIAHTHKQQKKNRHSTLFGWHSIYQSSV
jgi:hypothetical protein